MSSNWPAKKTSAAGTPNADRTRNDSPLRRPGSPPPRTPLVKYMQTTRRPRCLSIRICWKTPNSSSWWANRNSATPAFALGAGESVGIEIEEGERNVTRFQRHRRVCQCTENQIQRRWAQALRYLGITAQASGSGGSQPEEQAQWRQSHGCIGTIPRHNAQFSIGWQ